MADPSAPDRGKGVIPAWRNQRAPSLDVLSHRERQVFSGIVHGLTNKQIAIEPEVSHRTVEIHGAHLMRKLNVTSLTALLAWADASSRS